jgi:multifunctional beta-oxidation protein
LPSAFELFLFEPADCFSRIGGFKQPILHGLGFFGIAGKAIYDTYGPYNSIKVRFAGHLFPGETVQTLMWKEQGKVVFVAKCKERDTVIISNAAAQLA